MQFQDTLVMPVHPVASSRPDASAVLRRYNAHQTGRAEGPPLLLVHGYGCDQTVWQPLVDHLASDYRVMLMDLPGSGHCDPSAWQANIHSTLEGYARDVVRVVLALDLPAVALIGHSVGATIASLAAIELADRVSSVSLLAPSMCFLNKGDYLGGFSPEDLESVVAAIGASPIEWSASFAPVLMGASAATTGGDTWRKTFCAMDPQVAQHFARVTFLSDHRHTAPKVTARALVVQCLKDSLVPEHVGRGIADAMPRSTYAPLDIAGHCPHLTAPEATAAALRAFLVR